MARTKPSQSLSPDSPEGVATLPTAGGSYAAGGDGVLQQTEGMTETTPAARRGFGNATLTDAPTEA